MADDKEGMTESVLSMCLEMHKCIISMQKAAMDLEHQKGLFAIELLKDKVRELEREFETSKHEVERLKKVLDSGTGEKDKLEIEALRRTVYHIEKDLVEAKAEIDRLKREM